MGKANGFRLSDEVSWASLPTRVRPTLCELQSSTEYVGYSKRQEMDCDMRCQLCPTSLFVRRNVGRIDIAHLRTAHRMLFSFRPGTPRLDNFIS